MAEITANSRVAPANPTAEQIQHQASASENLKLATWLYLASETILFTVFIAAYVVFRVREPEFVHEIHEALGLGGILLVTLNSFLLLTSSWAMVMGLRQIQRNDVDGLKRWLSLTALLGTAFVILQYVEYSRLGSEGVTLYFSGDHFGGFGMHFYTPTAFHGLHVIIGVIWCLDVIRRARLGRYNQFKYTGVEVFGLYWHFVDVVWVVLFTLIYLV